MKHRIIIENRSDTASDQDCLGMVDKVIGLGRISNNETQYCYYTTFTLSGRGYGVATDRNKRSDRFVIEDQK